MSRKLKLTYLPKKFRSGKHPQFIDEVMRRAKMRWGLLELKFKSSPEANPYHAVESAWKLVDPMGTPVNISHRPIPPGT